MLRSLLRTIIRLLHKNLKKNRRHIQRINNFLVRSHNHNYLSITDFSRQIDEICALQGYYAEYSGISLPTFRDSLQWGPTGCPETSARNYHYTLRNVPAERITYFLIRILC